MIRLTPGLVLILAAGTAAHGAQTPVLRSNSTFVVVDTVVRDRQGQPVRGLRADDFEVRENGKAQVISTLSEVVGESTGDANMSGPGAARGAARQPSRLIVLVLDDAMLPPDPQILETARTIARGIVGRMAPTDVGAVVFSQAGDRGVEPTRDRAALLRAVDGLRPGSGGGPFAEQASITTLRNVAGELARYEQRATIAFIGIGLAIDTTVLTGATPIGAIGDPQGRTAALHRTLIDGIADAHRANASFYTFDASGVSGMLPHILARNPRMKVSDAHERARPYKDFLEAVAENTGGRAAANTNRFDEAMDRMFLETGAYYLLGYQSSDPRQEGRYRRLQVRAKRPGLHVQARRGYWEQRSSR